MEGMARAARRSADLSIHNGWHTAMFALSGYSGNLKGKQLSDFLSATPESDDTRVKSAQAIAFFHRLKARGVPVEITRH